MQEKEEKKWQALIKDDFPTAIIRATEEKENKPGFWEEAYATLENLAYRSSPSSFKILCQHCNQNNLEAIKKGIDEGLFSVDTCFFQRTELVNTADLFNQQTEPYQLALAKNNQDILDFLYQHSLKELHLNVTEHDEQIYYAIKFKQRKLLEQLLTKDNVNQVCKNGYAPIDYAVMLNQVELIKQLVEYWKINLNRTSPSKKTPIYHATYFGNLALVKYFVKHGANLSFSDDKNRSLLALAQQYGHLEISGYLEDEQKRQLLIKKKPYDIGSLRFKDYKPKGRRHSIITLINKYTSDEFYLMPEQTFQNNVRVFSDQYNKTVVKTIDTEWVTELSTASTSPSEFKENIIYHKKSIQREFNFFKKVNADQKLCDLADYTLKYPNHEEWTYIFIMPFITQFTLDEFSKSIISPKQLLKLFLTISLELQRIHKLYIIHGDIKPNNILVVPKTDPNTNIQITFIDFGCAYSKNYKYATTTSMAYYYWADERVNVKCVEKIPKPDFSQDVNSYSKTLQECIETASKVSYPNSDFKTSFPTFFSDLMKAQRKIPAERPSLEKCIEDIKLEIRKII